MTCDFGAELRDTFCLEMSYDGSGFFGWQSQPHGNTVQDVTEDVLASVLGTKVRLVPASRTDTGVHAEQQIAIFRLPPGTLPPDNFVQKCQALLPTSIVVKTCTPVQPRFHPRQDAKRKVYCYRLFCDRSPEITLKLKHWRIYRALDLKVLRFELQSLVGTLDFRSFCAGDVEIKNSIRTIFSVDVIENGPAIELWFVGNGFLKQMIRIIVGSAVSYACGRPQARPLQDLLLAKNRAGAGKTAPGSGLTLERIIY